MSDVSRQAVKSANRVLDLFELLGRWGDEMSHTEIANALVIPKSSLSQLLPNLVTRGYLDFSATTKGYRLGEKLRALANQVDDGKRLEVIAVPVLQSLTDAVGESSALNITQGNDAIVVASVNSPKRLVSHMRNGDLAPLHATSGGKCLLAFRPPHLVAEYMETVVFQPITPHTIASKEELTRQLATIVREGIAYSFEEFTLGIIGMAVPILGEAEFAIGSINVAMPAVRYNTKVRDGVVDQLERAARTIRHQLGLGQARKLRRD